MMAQLGGWQGGRERHGNIPERSVRSWNGWFLMDSVKILRKRETEAGVLPGTMG